MPKSRLSRTKRILRRSITCGESVRYRLVFNRSCDLELQVHIGANRLKNVGHEVPDKIVVVLQRDWAVSANDSGVSQIEDVRLVDAAEEPQEACGFI